MRKKDEGERNVRKKAGVERRAKRARENVNIARRAKVEN
jgi:hypothetical protein